MSNRERVCRFIADAAHVSTHGLSDSNNLVFDLGLDSLDVLNLVMDLEDEFGITIPQARINELKTVGDFVSVVDDLTK